jgi:hypothetical protein
MRVTNHGHYHIPNSVDLTREGYLRTQVVVQGQARHVAIFVSDAKADKHVIGGHWPAQQGGLHTGLTIDDDQFGPLFTKVGLDLVTEYLNRGAYGVWLELQYDAGELPGQYFSGHVGTREFRQATKVTVGGSVGFHATIGFHVYINHGPY